MLESRVSGKAAGEQRGLRRLPVKEIVLLDGSLELLPLRITPAHALRHPTLHGFLTTFQRKLGWIFLGVCFGCRQLRGSERSSGGGNELAAREVLVRGHARHCHFS